jgi:hypothetical protein
MEVNHQTQRDIQQFHVTEQLRLMDREHFLDALEFQQQAVLDQHIKAQRLIEDQALVFNADQSLVDARDASQLQFAQ